MSSYCSTKSRFNLEKLSTYLLVKQTGIVVKIILEQVFVLMKQRSTLRSIVFDKVFDENYVGLMCCAHMRKIIEKGDKKYTKNIQKIYKKYTKNIQKIYKKYTKNIQKIYNKTYLDKMQFYLN